MSEMNYAPACDMDTLKDIGAADIRYFEIANDVEADRAIRSIKADQENTERVIAIGEGKKQEIDRQIAAIRQRCEDRTKEKVDALERYFRTVEHRHTKTTEKYDLFSGTLTMKKGAVAPKVSDPEKLADWLTQNGREDLVKRKPKWGELKKQVQVSGDVVCIADTGEVVPGIEVEETPDKFTVDF